MRSSPADDIEKVKEPQQKKKKRCLEETQHAQARFLPNPLSPTATTLDIETFSENDNFIDCDATLPYNLHEESDQDVIPRKIQNDYY